MAYASRTGTRQNVAALAAAGWGWMVGPLDMGGPILGGMPYALDNGAWPCFSRGLDWDESAFLVALNRYGWGARFVVVPDVVADADKSLRLTQLWLPKLLARHDLCRSRILVAVQDGMQFPDILPLLIDKRVGIFIGGSTEWKERAIIPWGRWAKERDLYVHVGRVNTRRRILLCAAGYADSFDGTSATRFRKTLGPLDCARLQPPLI